MTPGPSPGLPRIPETVLMKTVHKILLNSNWNFWPEIWPENYKITMEVCNIIKFSDCCFNHVHGSTKPYESHRRKHG